MSGSAPVARELARIATARDVAQLTAHPDVADYGWEIAYDGDILVTVGLRARVSEDVAHQDKYTLTLNCDSYDIWPPETKFVNPTTGTYVVGQDTRYLPNIQNFPGFAVHADFSSFFLAGRRDQLVCFSYTRGYYDSNHSPAPHERWQQGRHWLYTTIRVLHRALQTPYYQGRLA